MRVGRNRDMGGWLYELLPILVVCQECDGQVVIAVSDAPRPFAWGYPDQIGCVVLIAGTRLTRGSDGADSQQIWLPVGENQK